MAVNHRVAGSNPAWGVGLFHRIDSSQKKVCFYLFLLFFLYKKTDLLWCLFFFILVLVLVFFILVLVFLVFLHCEKQKKK